MYDLIRFLPLLITFGVFPVLALLCLRFLDPGRRAAGLAVAGLLLLPPLCILAADMDVRMHDLRHFLAAAVPLIASYILLFVIHWILVRIWGTGPWGMVPVLFPLAVLAIAKYAPGHWGEFYSGKRFNVLYLGLSYVAFRLGLLAMEVRNQVVPCPSLAEYLGFTFMPLTLSVGPISAYSLFRRSLSKPAAPPISVILPRFLKGATKYLLLGNLFNQLTYAGLLGDGHPHPPVDVIVAIVAYYIYLYLNFSGYCDMVVATAACCGIEIQENFDAPFSARNLQDFWKRWHMTLGTFLRDLLFSPLSKYIATKQGGRDIQRAVAVSIFCVFLVIGVWHGVGWNFALYGAVHGVGVVTVHYYTQFLRKKLSRKAYQDYMANRVIKGAAIIVTQSFAALSLILFANSMPAVGRLLHSVAAWVPYAR